MKLERTGSAASATTLCGGLHDPGLTYVASALGPLCCSFGIKEVEERNGRIDAEEEREEGRSETFRGFCPPCENRLRWEPLAIRVFPLAVELRGCCPYYPFMHAGVCAPRGYLRTSDGLRWMISGGLQANPSDVIRGVGFDGRSFLRYADSYLPYYMNQYILFWLRYISTRIVSRVLL